MRKVNKTVLFIILTFTLSWGMAGLFYFSGKEYDNLSGTLLASTYMFVPLLAVIIIEKGIYKNKIRERLKISFKFNKWFLVAWLLMPVAAFVTLGISLLFPGITFSPEMTYIMERFESTLSPEQLEQMKDSMDTLPLHPIWLTLFQALIAGATINALFGFGEETGWRGFLLREMKDMDFRKASLFIGLIWGIWHAPLILMGHNYPEHPIAGAFMMIIWCILLSPIFNYITLKANSVIAASILHGTLNASSGIAIMLIAGGNDLTNGMTGLAGFITTILIITGLVWYDFKVSGERLMTQKMSQRFD